MRFQVTGVKHSRPFQDYKEFVPPPPNKLQIVDVKIIILKIIQN